MNQRAAPDENTNHEAGLGIHQLAQEIAQRRAILMMRTEPDAAVEIPADDGDRSGRQLQRVLELRIIIAAVDKHRKARGFLDAPCIPARIDNAHGRVVTAPVCAAGRNARL